MHKKVKVSKEGPRLENGNYISLGSIYKKINLKNPYGEDNISIEMEKTDGRLDFDSSLCFYEYHAK